MSNCNELLETSAWWSGHCYTPYGKPQFSSVQWFSHVRLFVTLWTATHQASLSVTNSRSGLKLMSIESVKPSNNLILCCPLLLVPSIFPAPGSFQMSQFFASGGQSIGVSASASVLPIEYSGLISFRMDWLDLLAVQETLKSLLQHHSSKASIFRHSAFFIVQLSHPYRATGKTIALTRRTFFGKVMPLLFNMLSKLVLAVHPRSQCLLISWLQSPSAVILESKKIKSLSREIWITGKEMATHSSILAWKIPWTEELAGCSPCSPKKLDMTTTKPHHHHHRCYFTLQFFKQTRY